MRNPEQVKAKAELADKIAAISEPSFIRDYVYGCMPEFKNGSRPDAPVEIETIQNDGTGAATVEYTIAGSQRVFAKLFKDELGPHSYQVLRSLWDDGFGREQAYRVSEPLRYFDDLNLLLMRAAEGTCLADYLGRNGTDRDLDKAMAGVERAAGWLLRLHESSVRVGNIDQPWYVFGKLTDRLSKASAAHPSELKRLTGFIDPLRALAARQVDTEVVQVHGQFRPIHVFLGDDAVTVIDLDRSVLADPAKDIAEFVHRLRTTIIRTANGDTEHADAMARRFLAVYGAERPERLRNVPFFQGFHIVVSLCRHMKRLDANDPMFQPTIDFYSGEFADVVAGKLLP